MAGSPRYPLLGGMGQQEGTSGGSEAPALLNRYRFFFFVNQVMYYESHLLGETDFSWFLSLWAAEDRALKRSLRFLAGC